MPVLPARYFINIGRDRSYPDQVVVRVLKGWWGGPGVGGRSRLIGECWTAVNGLGETEAVRAALHDAWLLLADELS